MDKTGGAGSAPGVRCRLRAARLPLFPPHLRGDASRARRALGGDLTTRTSNTAVFSGRVRCGPSFFGSLARRYLQPFGSALAVALRRNGGGGARRRAAGGGRVVYPRNASAHRSRVTHSRLAGALGETLRDLRRIAAAPRVLQVRMRWCGGRGISPSAPSRTAAASAAPRRLCRRGGRGAGRRPLSVGRSRKCHANRGRARARYGRATERETNRTDPPPSSTSLSLSLAPCLHMVWSRGGGGVVSARVRAGDHLS